jgi:hypothetical protein
MEDPILIASPYTVRSKVSLSDFPTFVSALQGASVVITKDKTEGLSRLCEEFHFGALADFLSQFRESDDLKGDLILKDFEARKCLSALQERMQQRDCEIAALRTELLRHSRVQESSSETSFDADVSALPTASALPLATPPSGSVRPAHPSPSGGIL